MKQLVNFWYLIVDLARSFTFMDLLDVLLVTLLLYALIKLLRDSRAAQLVKGLIFLMLFYLLTNILQLKMINTILTYFFQSAFIVIVILFQPELRKALEQLGRSDVGTKLKIAVNLKDESDEVKNWRNVIDATIQATVILQQLKMGALIIFERKTKLGEIAATGTIIDAEASGQLISNIFFNKAPLHDGGMIIRDGRVYAAGCILPLTKNNSLSATLGTRHRAALGLSEESDAVVIVVSEETAQISVAIDGVLTRNFDKDTLRAVLEKEIVDTLNSSSSGNHTPWWQFWKKGDSNK
jgi:diadenylate cyclase